MKYGRFIDERTIKTGPIKRTIQDPGEFITYRNNESRLLAGVNLIDFADDIEEGVVFYQDYEAIYKVSSKMVTQLPFEHIRGVMTSQDRESLDKIWEGDLRYYIPDVYFCINFNSSYRGVSGMSVIFEKGIFLPILNLFTPSEIRIMYGSYTRDKLNSLLPGSAHDYISSSICYGHSLTDIDTSTPANVLAGIGHISNTILSAPSNADLLPNSDESTTWILGRSDSIGLSMDFMLRSLSNISQKISQEEYLELLRKSHKDPRHIFNKLLEVNDYSNEDTKELTDLFLRTQFDYTYIKSNRDALVRELKELEG